MWGRKGQQIRVISPSVRHKVGFFAVLNLKIGQLVIQKAPAFGALISESLFIIGSNLLRAKYMFDSGQSLMA